MAAPTVPSPTLKDLGGNRLLALLARTEQEKLLPLLRREVWRHGQTLYEAGGPIPSIYFPLRAVASELSTMEDGTTVEVATIGNEGMLGISVLLGGGTLPLQVIAQIPGPVLAMKREDFQTIIDRKVNGFRSILDLYIQALLTQIAQQSACNRAHVMTERCARWILMTHDRVQEDEFPLTHEFLAYMLGARRASVSVAAGMLTKAGFITSTRGTITVLDRTRLEEASCECYGVISREYNRLLGFRP